MHINARKVTWKESHQAVNSGQLRREGDRVSARDFHLLLSYTLAFSSYCWHFFKHITYVTSKYIYIYEKN